MANLLIIDTELAGLDLALRASAAGHAVRMFAYSAKPTKYGTGFKQFKMVDDYRSHMAWAKEGLIYLTGNSRYLTDLDRYRTDFGFTNIFGPTVASARLEIDRSAGMDAIRSIGLDVPPFETFKSLEDAAEFAKKSDRVYVFKPAGDEPDKSLTYVSKDQADMVGWIRRQIDLGKKLKDQCLLQEKIDKLVEIGVSGWMGPEGFIRDKLQICFEHKSLGNDETGPATGEMANVSQYVDTDKLADEMLLPLEPILRTLGHRGDTAIGAMIDTKGKAHFLEFTMRTGHPACWIQAASHRGDPVSWMVDLMAGKDSLKVSNDVAIGVILAQPNHPYANAVPAHVEGVPIRGIEDVLPDIHLVEAMMGKGPVMEDGKVIERPTFQTAGEYVAVATSLGKTIEKARKKVYAVAKAVHWPDKIMRTDAGLKVIKALPALKRHGYALDLEA